MLFQRMWQRGVGWDDELPDDLRKEWMAWCTELRDLRLVTTPRCLLWMDGELNSLQLQVFTDASPSAYGACAYLRVVNNTGDVILTLIIAKVRVALLKTLSLPRLELMGALLGARLNVSLRTNVFDTGIEVWHWKDAMITLGSIRGSSTGWKPFLCNRVTEIQAKSDPSSWYHCPGSMNPADLMTRGKTVRQLSVYDEWWFGPDWLRRDLVDWPPAASPANDLPSDIEAERRHKVNVLLHDASVPYPLLTLENFGSYTRMLRVTAWVLCFVQNCRLPRGSTELSLSAAEIRNAELLWIRNAQHECFDAEIRSLSQSEEISARSKIKDLQPFSDEAGVMRIRGRLHHALLPEGASHPIILPKDHDLSKLVAASAHQRTLRGGVQVTMTELRQRV
ncbi:uncharacterized protein LOC120843527 [Ixodes scapularis]|uniref:uncharacterized protein LOC120843527 n=1 Tax=Ixodes scapularis TaxID=6945 RepID=UPI001A9F74EB|nr:uncharacterized protein LOC120843527 [Ixodes scapularis]